MILWDTLATRLYKEHNVKYIDVRYVSEYFTKYPHIFPKFMLTNNYTITFNSDKLRYEISKSK